MKRCYLLLLLALSPFVSAETRTLKIAGNQSVATAWNGDRPITVNVRGYATDTTALIFNADQLIPRFGFRAPRRANVVSVRVEDVTGEHPVTLIDDRSPKLRNDRWIGDAPGKPVSESSLPWIFSPGDTVQIFRFTIQLKGEAEPLVILQPACFPASAKVMMRSLVNPPPLLAAGNNS